MHFLVSLLSSLAEKPEHANAPNTVIVLEEGYTVLWLQWRIYSNMVTNAPNITAQYSICTISVVGSKY